MSKQPPKAPSVFRDFRIDLRIGSLEIDVGHDRRAAMTGAREIDHVDILLDDHAIQVRVDETEARRRSPVSEKSRLDVLGPQRFANERILLKKNLADGEVVGPLPIAMDPSQLFVRERPSGLCTHGGFCALGGYSAEQNDARDLGVESVA